jgi:hypothetical protein
LLVKNAKLWSAAIFILALPANLFPLTPTSFDAPRAYPLGTNSYPYWPTSVAVADLNGDGYLDAVVVGYQYSQSEFCYDACPGYVSILLGKGGGEFQAQMQLDTGLFPSCVVIADVNGDGKPDLVIATTVVLSSGANRGAVTIMLGNGDGTFQAPVSYDSAAGDS